MANRLLTINIRNYLVQKPRRKRQVKIAKYLRNRVSHYTKIDEENVKISRELNDLMTKSHAKSMLPIKLNVSIENGIASVSPFNAKKPAAATTATSAATPAKIAKEKKAPAATKQKATAKTEAPKAASPA